jgi:hypothetical protein
MSPDTPLRPRSGPAADPHQLRLLAALDQRLAVPPAMPRQMAAAVRALARDPDELAASPLALVPLQTLRRELFEAPRRDAELRSLWRESVTTAWLARCVAAAAGAELGGDPDEAATLGLLGRLPEAWLLRALGVAEAETGVRIALSLQALREPKVVVLAAALREAWRFAGLPAAMTGRYEPGQAEGSAAFRSAQLAWLLAGELLHPDSVVPGVADSAAAEFGLAGPLLASVRSQLWRIVPLLERIA